MVLTGKFSNLFVYLFPVLLFEHEEDLLPKCNKMLAVLFSTKFLVNASPWYDYLYVMMMKLYEITIQ